MQVVIHKEGQVMEVFYKFSFKLVEMVKVHLLVLEKKKKISYVRFYESGR